MTDAAEALPITAETVSSTAASAHRLIRVRELWTRSRPDQIEIGRLLYEERAERIGSGTHDRDGFHQWLREAGIPKTSAYRRIAEYEISIGERSEDEPFDKPRVPNGTTPAGWQPVSNPPQGDEDDEDDEEEPDFVDAPEEPAPTNSWTAAHEASAEYRKERAASANVDYQHRLRALQTGTAIDCLHALERSAEAALVEDAPTEVIEATVTALTQTISDLTVYLKRFTQRLPAPAAAPGVSDEVIPEPVADAPIELAKGLRVLWNGALYEIDCVPEEYDGAKLPRLRGTDLHSLELIVRPLPVEPAPGIPEPTPKELERQEDIERLSKLYPGVRLADVDRIDECMTDVLDLTRQRPCDWGVRGHGFTKALRKRYPAIASEYDLAEIRWAASSMGQQYAAAGERRLQDDMRCRDRALDHDPSVGLRILGLTTTATQDEIRSAYRALARKFHPDLNDAPGAATRMGEINRAYAVLSEAA